MTIKQFGFGTGDEGLDTKGRRFKAKEGERYRVSFVWWEGLDEGKPNLDAESPIFLGCKRLYLPGVGYFADKSPEHARLAGGPGKMYAATMLVLWPTDSQGNLDKARFAAGDYRLNSWVISAEKYRTVEGSHREFPLGKHDMTLTCTDTQYQKITFNPCRESLFRKLVDAGKAGAIIAAARELALEMPNELAQDLTIEQVREKMGRAPGGSPVGPTPSSGPGSFATSASEFDAMLDDIAK